MFGVFARDKIGWIQQAFCATSASAWQQVARLKKMRCWRGWRITLPTVKR